MKTWVVKGFSIGLFLWGISVLNAGTYVFDSSNAYWYDSGEFTQLHNDQNLYTEIYGTNGLWWVGNNANQIIAYGGTSPNSYSLNTGAWAGAEWTAPAGEVVTQVTVSGMYRSDQRNMGYGVLGGRVWPEEMVLIQKQDGTDFAGLGWNIWEYSGTTANVSASCGIRKLQFRSWWKIGTGSEVIWGYPNVNNYFGRLTSITIVTASVDAWRYDVTPGHRILIDKGLQIQALTYQEDDYGNSYPFSIPTFTASNFTTANFWGYVLRPEWLGSAPGIPWARYGFAALSLSEDREIPYLDKMVSFQYKDDSLSDFSVTNPDHLSYIQGWFAYNRLNYPNVISHTDQSGGRDNSTYDNLRNYCMQTRPDMLMFCDYPFNGSQDGNSIGWYYNHLQTFRQSALAGLDGNGSQPIPNAVYLQTVNGGSHTPSESEFFLNQFAPWAFGYKMVTAYNYTTPRYSGGDLDTSILFNGLGDGSPRQPQFNQIAEVNRQSRNLGPALVRLLRTDIRILMGQHQDNFLFITWTDDNSAPGNVTTTLNNVTDSYITGITVSNISGSNDGKRGDVLVGFFKPLHESFDGPSYSNQQYFMVVNGLIHQANGSVAYDSRQQIRINFNFGSSGITSLQRLRRSDGQVEVVNSTSQGWYYDGGSQYHLEYVLNGGNGDLYKYNTGTPFVGKTSGLP